VTLLRQDMSLSQRVCPHTGPQVWQQGLKCPGQAQANAGRAPGICQGNWQCCRRQARAHACNQAAEVRNELGVFVFCVLNCDVSPCVAVAAVFKRCDFVNYTRPTLPEHKTCQTNLPYCASYSSACFQFALNPPLTSPLCPLPK